MDKDEEQTGKDLDYYLFKYIDRFGENFPTFHMLGATDDDLITAIKECLKKGKPYETEDEPGVLY